MQQRIVGGSTPGNGLFCAVKDDHARSAPIPLKKPAQKSAYIVETEKTIEKCLISVMQEQYSQITRELSAKVSEAADALAQLEPIRAERDDAINDLSEAHADNDFLKTLNQRLQERARVLEPEVITLRAELEQLRRASLDLQRKLTLKDEQIASQQCELVSLRSQLSQSSVDLQSVRHVESEISTLRHELDLERLEKENITTTVEQLSAETQRLEDVINALRAQLEEGRELQKAAVARAKKVEDSRARTDLRAGRIDKEIEELRKVIQAKDEELTAFEGLKRRLNLKLRDVTHRLSKAESVIAENESVIAAVNSVAANNNQRGGRLDDSSSVRSHHDHDDESNLPGDSSPRHPTVGTRSAPKTKLDSLLGPLDMDSGDEYTTIDLGKPNSGASTSSGVAISTTSLRNGIPVPPAGRQTPTDASLKSRGLTPKAGPGSRVGLTPQQAVSNTASKPANINQQTSTLVAPAQNPLASVGHSNAMRDLEEMMGGDEFMMTEKAAKDTTPAKFRGTNPFAKIAATRSGADSTPGVKKKGTALLKPLVLPPVQ